MDWSPSAMPDSLRSIGATMTGLASLALGVAMVGATGFEVLLASGAADRSARLGLPTLGLGVVLLAVGSVVLGWSVSDAEDTPDEDGTVGQEADMYLFDT